MAPLLENFMKLFISIVLIAIGLMGLTIIISTAYYDEEKFKTILIFLEKVSSFLGGVGGVVAAIAAYIGVDTWKKQIKFAKHQQLIWECLASVRKVQSRSSLWLAEIIASPNGKKIAEASHSENYGKLLAAAEELMEKFDQLDAIVVKNGSEWANYASDYLSAISNVDKEITVNEVFNDTIKGEISKRLKYVQGFADHYEKKLNKLELS